jgi:RimJ/RimL family protein N-acetyltransferase
LLNENRMNSTYKILTNQGFHEGSYCIVPIRFEDRFAIMKWRNEQMYHLRQKNILTNEDQEQYFSNVISQLFSQQYPNQILFSYLENEKCIGYGGLVHINWVDKHAEISFLVNITHIHPTFTFHWKTFLRLIEKVAFVELNLHKIYTYAYDLRENLYDAIESCGFIQEARLKEHLLYENKYIDVIIHSKINS